MINICFHITQCLIYITAKFQIYAMMCFWEVFIYFWSPSWILAAMLNFFNVWKMIRILHCLDYIPAKFHACITICITIWKILLTIFYTKHFLFDLKMHQKSLAAGAPPQMPHWGAYSATPFWQCGRGGRGKGGEGRGRGKMCSPLWNPKYATAHRALSPIPSPLNVGLRPRAQITSSFATYVL